MTQETAKPLTADDLADLKAKAEAATPTDKAGLARYEHGGGRLAIIPPDPSPIHEKRERKLIADFYHEGDREFYTAANPEAIQRLIATIEQQAEQIEKLGAVRK